MPVPIRSSARSRTFSAGKSMHRVSLIPVITLLAIGCSGAAATPDNVIPPVPITLADVSRESVSRAVTATGSFGPKDEISLSFKIGGIVARISVDEGDVVSRGAVLGALDLREIDAQITKAKTGFDKATRDLVRIRALYADSVTTLAQLQDAESALAIAQADRDAAQVNRDYAVITAPVSGRVLRRRVQPGALVGPGQEVISLGSDNRGRVVRIGVPDRDAVRLAIAQVAEVKFDATPGITYTGRVSQRGAATDARTGMVSVEITVTGADALPAGTVANVSIAVPSTTQVTLVPVESIIEADGDSATVYSMKDGRAVRHSVRILFVNGARVAVEGLDNVQRVVQNGAAYLTDSATVRDVSGAK